MGFSICYLGLRCPVEKAAEYLSLDIEAEEPGDWPPMDSWVGMLKGSDWTLVWLEDARFVEKNIALLESASQKVDLIACEVVESVMWASAQYWSNGDLKWKVTHAGDGDDIFNLTETGTLPPDYSAIRTEHFKNQEQENESDDEFGCDHIFEIPLDLAAVSLKFRHEQALEAADFVSFRGIVPPPRKGLIEKVLSLFK
ncbi:hypothetical protein [uncultured Roseibium sp.]|uniref:hypothetical protein n=1 Tax=uncultured Roseibium sp. TaxID=1936171 RepID=UPI00321801A3